MISDYRARLYRLIFTLAAVYNAAFGLWASLWPRSFFDWLEMAPPNYPGLWRCLGMVVGLYGVLYAQATWKLDAGRTIIAVGLVGKILGPLGWMMTVHSGEWPRRTFVLIVFNDLIWWLPFSLFLLEGSRVSERLRRAAPWICSGMNALAGLGMLLLLRGGTEAVPVLADRIAYISSHALWWRAGWVVWMAAAVSSIAFYAWWGAWLPSAGWGIAAVAVGALGLVCDFFAEALFIGWWPDALERLGPLATLLSGGFANGFYTMAGVLLTIGSPGLRGPLRLWAWATWTAGFLLTAATFAGSVPGMILASAIVMPSFCAWVAVFGWVAFRDRPTGVS